MYASQSPSPTALNLVQMLASDTDTGLKTRVCRIEGMYDLYLAK